MVRDLQMQGLRFAAGIALQLIGQLPVRIEQPPMTRFEMSAASAAVE
jgi:hypothetical protein